MGVHPDKTAERAVDACGGVYTEPQKASGYADGHFEALDTAMMAVRPADALMAELLSALDDLTFTVGVTAIKHVSQLPALEKAVIAARAVIAKATGAA